ncbi:MAG: amylo-alpha-1,6-glucosidase [Acidimicrobiales bacterium]
MMAATPWTYAGAIPAVAGPSANAVTLVDESTFAISDQAGDMVPGAAHGLFVRDKRVLSRFELRVDDAKLEPLAALDLDPFRAVFVSRRPPAMGRADSTLVVFRTRYVGNGMREDLEIRNFGSEATACLVEGFVDADFADLFAVKEGRAGHDPNGDVTCSVDGELMVFAYHRGPTSRGVQLRFIETAPADPERNAEQEAMPGTERAHVSALRISEDHVSAEVMVPARGAWRACVEVSPLVESSMILPRYRCGQPFERAEPSERMAKWREQVPLCHTEHEGLETIMQRSIEDLGALRIFDPDHPEHAVIAAGAPWFMTVFGRDSLLASWSALLIDPDLALGVLQTLARFQGKDLDPVHEEQPGRILHEMRFGDAPSLSLGGGSIYYGTVDATPLFVMLIAELRRWGLDKGQMDELLPSADRALEWIEQYGDADGDGYVEYRRMTDRGLANQGWKDSFDGIRYANGRIAEAPIALCEVQAYVYGAYRARAAIARDEGDSELVERYTKKASELKVAFNRDFFLEERGWFAVGLDPDKHPIDSLTSNMGHCLWTGIVEEDKAAAIAEHLTGPDMSSGWGVRTLAKSMSAYNPVSYHCGSVWPHDTAINAAGLARYGFEEKAQQLVLALFDAAIAQGGRLPELYSGLDRSELPVPVSYPTSCSPQAWAAASPLLCLRTLLGLDPDIASGKVWLAPMLPASIGDLRLEGIPLGGARVSVDITGEETVIAGLPEAVELIREHRGPAET